MQLFLLLKWNIAAGMDVIYLGLDFGLLDSTLAWSGLDIPTDQRPQVFAQLHTMQAIARPLLNKRD